MKKLLVPFLLSSALNISAQEFNYHPQSNNDLYIVSYDEFSLSYNDDHRQPNWVAYELTSYELNQSMVRRDYFKEDKNTGTKWALLSDYKRSGYDRGHLCRAMYCKSGTEAYKQSYLLSNMSPQIGVRFNRSGGSWYNLEELEISLAHKYGRIFSVSGPVFRNNLGTIGVNKITIPGYYYKAYLTPDFRAAAAVILRHEKGKLKEFTLVSVDSLEGFTGIDFFPALPDDIEEEVESGVEINYWQITDRSAYTVSVADTPAPAINNISPSPSVSIQCAATAKTTGVQCKRKTTNTNGLCWQHQENKHQIEEKKITKPAKTTPGQCRATTQAGSRCKRSAGTNGYCWQH